MMAKTNFIPLLLSLIFISCGNDQKTQKTQEDQIKIQQYKKEEKKDINNDEKITIRLGSSDQMLFDKRQLKVKVGQEVTLILTHTGKLPKNIMGHNFVLLKKGIDVFEFAQKASTKKDNDYIPEGDQTIAYTKMIGGGETTQITFSAPEKGIYDFICSFPAHYSLMKGKFIVE